MIAIQFTMAGEHDFGGSIQGRPRNQERQGGKGALDLLRIIQGLLLGDDILEVR